MSIVESCPSTNDLARALARDGAPHGAWISARRQTAGRGRAGRSWVSEPGNLFLSIVLRPAAPSTWIPLLVAVGACRAVGSPRVRIKWPNDLWVDDAKLGGILCEAREGFVIAGIGINCVSEPTVDQPTVSLSGALGRAVTADDIREPVVREVLAAVANPADARAEFAARSVIRPGQAIAWRDGAGGERTGVARGLGEHGELLVECEGETRRLFSEDVRVLRAV